MNENQDHIFKSLETIFWGVKILNFFDAYPVTGMEKKFESGMKKFGSEIRDGNNSDPGSGMFIPDPQH
jgi:hypothetical protein